jgi:peroxiredoxin
VRSLRGTAFAAALAIAATGCAAGGAGAGGGGKSVLDATWGWGWDLSGASGPYAQMSPAERERELDYYRSRVRTEDAAGNPVPLVEQVAFLPAAEAAPNAPTGAAPPEGGFVDATGRAVRLEDWKGKATLVLVFTRGYPGYLCPLCSSYTAQIAHRYGEIRDAGGEVLVVFPGAKDKVEEFVRAARAILEEEGPGALPFPVLLDRDLAAVTSFGIVGDLAKPSTYVIDRAGSVRYAFVGSQPHERPDLDTILAEVRRAEGKK